MTKTMAPMAGLFTSLVLVVKFTLYMRGIRAVNREIKPTTAEMRKTLLMPRRFDISGENDVPIRNANPIEAPTWDMDKLFFSVSTVSCAHAIAGEEIAPEPAINLDTIRIVIVFP